MLQANYSVELWFLILIKKSMFTSTWLEKMHSFLKEHERSQAWNLKKERTNREKPDCAFTNDWLQMPTVKVQSTLRLKFKNYFVLLSNNKYLSSVTPG